MQEKKNYKIRDKNNKIYDSTIIKTDICHEYYRI